MSPTSALLLALGLCAVLLGLGLLARWRMLWKRAAAERQRSHDAMRRSEERFRALTQLSSDWYWEQDDQFRFVRLDGELEAKTGIKVQDHVGLHRWDMPALNMTDADWDAHRRILQQHLPFRDLVMQRPTRNGREHWVSISGAPVFDADGRFSGYRGIGTDITGRKHAEDKLRLAASVFTHAREAILIIDAEGAILDVNQAFTDITGHALDEVLGRHPRLLQPAGAEGEAWSALWRELRATGQWQGEIWHARKSGELFAVMLTVSAVRDAAGRVRQYVGLFTDITAMKEHERQLQQIAHFDPLTQLPNRLLLADRLHQAMAQARRRGAGLAVVYADLDGFKAVNDRHGHSVGDQLLAALAQRMKSALREGDTLARIGGDEFVAVLVDLGDVAAAMPVLQRLLAAAAAPVDLGGVRLEVTASLGLTFYAQESDLDADQLLRQADHAMYQAKLAGKNSVHVFNAERDRSLRGHHESLQRLREALQRGEFELHYQPCVNLRSGEVVGVEALIRWRHPERGLLLPAEFMPAIDDDPLQLEVGEWVLDQALAQAARWRAAGLPLAISVNVGARQLQHPQFLQRLESILRQHPSVPRWEVGIEMLESSALEDLGQVSRVIEACAASGPGFAIDDFGTGYSSLTYLKRLPVQRLKVDRSFVGGMLDDPDDLAIVVGVLGLASTFGRQMVAEGMETAAHGRMLLQLGCELAQGNGISPPLMADELPGWLKDWRPDPGWATVPRSDPWGAAIRPAP